MIFHFIKLRSPAQNHARAALKGKKNLRATVWRKKRLCSTHLSEYFTKFLHLTLIYFTNGLTLIDLKVIKILYFSSKLSTFFKIMEDLAGRTVTSGCVWDPCYTGKVIRNCYSKFIKKWIIWTFSWFLKYFLNLIFFCSSLRTHLGSIPTLRHFSKRHFGHWRIKVFFMLQNMSRK